MKMLRQEQFITISHEFIDSCAWNVMGDTLFRVYWVLRRFVWRSDEKGHPASILAWKSGKLSTRISQAQIGAMVGIQRQKVNAAIQRLKALGWLEVEHPATGDLALYVLGEWAPDSRGGHHGVFWADSWAASLWEHMERRAEEILMAGYKVYDLPVEQRERLVFEFLGDLAPMFNGGSKPAELDENLDTPCLPKETGVSPQGDRGVSPERDRGVSPQRDTLKDNLLKTESERKNREEAEHASRVGNLSPATPERRGVPALLRSEKVIPRRTVHKLADITEEEADHVVAPASPNTVTERMEGLAAHIEEAKKKAQKAREASMQRARSKEKATEAFAGGVIPEPTMRVLKRFEEIWSSEMKAKFAGVDFARWGAHERRLVKDLMQKYDGLVVEHALTYVVRNWDVLRDRFFKGRGGVPSLEFLVKFHSTLVVEAQQWANFEKAKTEWDKFFEDNPRNPNPPAELEERYQRARREYEALGLKTG